MSSKITVELVNALLGSWKYIEVSATTNPRDEVNYRIVEHNFINTITGVLLIMKLETLDTNEVVHFSIPDIQEILLNDHSNEYHNKIYFECKVRHLDDMYKEFTEIKKNGIEKYNEELNFITQHKIMTQRIILSNK